MRAAILSSLPDGWSLAETKEDQIPWGHYWGMQYDGRGGELLILAGPRDVPLLWRDREGSLHEDPMAKESLELWVMHPQYRNGWFAFLKFHRPVQPELVYSSQVGRVYGRQSHRLHEPERFDAVLSQARSTNWPESPSRPGNPLSWTSWKDDLRKALTDTRE